MIYVDRNQFEHAMDDAGLYEDSLREDYSGRSMYGKTCVGIVCKLREFATFCACLGSFADDWDFVSTVEQDSMGLETIWYFPGVQFARDEAKA